MAEKLKITKLKTRKDRISSLPEQAINKILGSLPIRDAISTSFLSKDWRYKWRSMSDLIFHSDSFFRSERGPPSSFSRIYLSKIHRILFLHRGDIRMFKFDSSGSEVINSKVDLWMVYLVVASVQQLCVKEDGTSLSTSDEFWNDQRNFSFSSFDNLKEFDITDVHGSKSELRFIKYILGKAPLLEVSNIKIDWSTIAFGERKMGDILIQLLSFERISTAKVIIDESESD
ncbi:hypothetical protein ZOSMA_274G00040 [Zostera marina]|uniref:F-box domain-containing protein n=1 Tax=Zostera marina TaxID=29655 RepID=A0A0K9PDQ7_ZOSMR|nr:hypothetical protein ZOSMA_274G00040 [Zostera marina]